MGRKNKSRHPWQYSARIPNSERPKCNGLEFIRKALTVSATADSGQNNANHPQTHCQDYPNTALHQSTQPKLPSTRR